MCEFLLLASILFSAMSWDFASRSQVLAKTSHAHLFSLSSPRLAKAFSCFNATVIAFGHRGIMLPKAYLFLSRLFVFSRHCAHSTRKISPSLMISRQKFAELALRNFAPACLIAASWTARITISIRVIAPSICKVIVALVRQFRHAEQRLIQKPGAPGLNRMPTGKHGCKKRATTDQVPTARRSRACLRSGKN